MVVGATTKAAVFFLLFCKRQEALSDERNEW